VTDSTFLRNATKSFISDAVKVFWVAMCSMLFCGHKSIGSPCMGKLRWILDPQSSNKPVDAVTYLELAVSCCVSGCDD